MHTHDAHTHGRWEHLHNGMVSNRVPLSRGASGDDEVLSPAAPGMFALTASYYSALGGLDTSLYFYGQESVELSLRVWLCGGQY